LIAGLLFHLLQLELVQLCLGQLFTLLQCGCPGFLGSPWNPSVMFFESFLPTSNIEEGLSLRASPSVLGDSARIAGRIGFKPTGFSIEPGGESGLGLRRMGMDDFGHLRVQICKLRIDSPQVWQRFRGRSRGARLRWYQGVFPRCLARLRIRKVVRVRLRVIYGFPISVRVYDRGGFRYGIGLGSREGCRRVR